MHRRTFLQMAAAAPAVLAADDHKTPKYRVVSHYQPAAHSGDLRPIRESRAGQGSRAVNCVL
ncbi:MAG: hypothetical protein ACLP59_27665 [Bryobacteraceae bacterium]